MDWTVTWELSQKTNRGVSQTFNVMSIIERVTRKCARRILKANLSQEKTLQVIAQLLAAELAYTDDELLPKYRFGSKELLTDFLHILEQMGCVSDTLAVVIHPASQEEEIRISDMESDL
jgi:DNA primase large subunit